VPCYNETEVLHETSARLTNLLNRLVDAGKVSPNSFVLFVNDGSRDNTWELIEKLYQDSKYIYGLNLAGNVGHQNALMAGLMTAKEMSDIIISIDADLQDDVEVIEQMVDKYSEGFDIVYGVRSSRKTDTFFKRNSALAFYKLMKSLGVNSVYNHADYRLMSKRAVEQLSCFKERNLFLRGIVPLIGYNTTSVYYKRSERFAGDSKYPIRKMINFAIDGITSFSVKPVRMIAATGLIILFLSLLGFIYVLYVLFAGGAVAGWASIILSIWFMGSIILISIGVIGEYIGKIYIEVKERPRYNIETLLCHKDEKND
ncbi:MAG: glycosyltransferase family 2 protein, partial [Bacteroidaceae bacterium]